MEDVVTLVIHHGGRVVWQDEYVPQYIGGSTFQMHIFKEEITYERLHQIARWELQYESADRMFYLPHGQNMSNGMVEIFSEMSVSHGLLYSGIDGVITVYMTCIVNDEEFAGDNMTKGVGVQDRGADGDEEVQRLVAEDDSDRTTDPEFYEVLNNLGILGLRRKFRSQRANGGKEVDQVYEEMESSTGPANHGPLNTGPAPSETNSQPNEDDDEYIHDNLESLSNDYGSDADDEGVIPEPTKQPSIDSSYRNSSGSYHIYGNSSDEEHESRFEVQPWYDPNCDHKMLQFKVGMRFKDASQFRAAVVENSIAKGMDVKWVRSSLRKKEAVCRQKCGCRLYASWYGRNRAIVIKSMGLPHSCTRSLRMKQMTARWIAKTYLERFRGNQIVDSSALAAEIKKTYSVEVTTRTCYRAKMYAKRLIEGTIMESYGKLRSYILELKRADPRGRFILEVDPTPNGDHVLFKRFFVGFSCLREGFLSACRPMFAMDGCFLKGEIKGMLLAAVGKDGNNQMFPICWVVVEGENKDYWNWFLEVVQEELHLGDGSGWSIISDQQKVSVCVH
ncbi:hypothetical protein LINGRAHAP2_LOCUS25324 [Linum grandiflorum]